jgi:hypothetical protein
VGERVSRFGQLPRPHSGGGGSGVIIFFSKNFSRVNFTHPLTHQNFNQNCPATFLIDRLSATVGTSRRRRTSRPRWPATPPPLALRAPAARRDPAHADASQKGRRHEGKSAGAPHQHGATASRLSIACLNFRCLARGGILRGGGTGRSTAP